MTGPDDTGTGPVIHDNRRIDPVTGQVRRGKHAASKPAGTAGAGRGPESGGARHGRETDMPGRTERPEQAAAADEASGAEDRAAAEGPGAAAPDGQEARDLATQLAERTADLQRLQAEYANYRKRVDRDRAAVREYAVANVLADLLPALDAIGQAREHGELSGGFKSVADSLQSALNKMGLVSYGERGDAFDPKIHEALTHTYSPDVTQDTCVEIFQPGYKVGERILRPARVAVAEPETGPDGVRNGDGDGTAGDGGSATGWPSGEGTD
ncbi:MAG: nucleotide exchange factor GrpE [Streptosporangiaceae bacterium]|nr:nucleotide exchange factor GrpE [Streptosporangiaceae bacterium]MBV9856233.1 nucleotide exchange factor GrpE [Streptosporangiaceae bacterium]